MTGLETLAVGRAPTARTQNVTHRAPDVLPLDVVEFADVVDDCLIDRPDCRFAQM